MSFVPTDPIDPTASLAKPSPFVVFTEHAIPATFDESLSYQQALYALNDYIQKKVVPVINENAKITEEQTAVINQLQEYVNTYFDNLDVQEEINNKLDEMAESGQLADIIAMYLNSNAIMAYDTVEDLEEAENVVNGSFARTYGKEEYNDGKGAFYKIRSIKNTDVIDGDNIVALPDVTLVAEKMPDFAIETLNTELDNLSQSVDEKITFLTPEQFGAEGDGVNDDTSSLQDCIDEAITSGLPILANNTYLITESLSINGTITIEGNKGYDKLAETDKLTFEFTGTGYLFDCLSEYDGSLFKNMRIKGNGENKIFKNTGYRNTYDTLTIFNADTGIDFPGTIAIWRGENVIKDCMFSDCSTSINIDHKLYADSTIKGCTFVHGDYSVYGSFNAWLFADNHDYTYHGVEVVDCANTQFVGNYFDKSQYMPFIKITNNIKGGVVIANNKFLAGANISTPTNLIEFVNNTGGSDLIVSNNVTSGTKYNNSYFLGFTGNATVNVALSGNLVFGICAKVIKNAQYVNKNSMVSYGGWLPATSISGSANFNQIFFNNGVGHIQLEVSNAGAVIGVLPFNPAIAVRVPAWNASKGVGGSILLNTNGNITNNGNWQGDTILINATYLVYWNGQFGDLT